MNRLFEIPEINPLMIEMKDSEDNSNSLSLKSLFEEYRSIRNEIRKRMESDDEIKFLFNYLYGEFDGRLGKAHVMEQLFVKPESKKGIFEYYDAKNKRKYPNTIRVYKNTILSEKTKLDFVNFSKYPYFEKNPINDIIRLTENLRHLRESCPNTLKIGGSAIFVPSYSYESLCFPFLCKIFFDRVLVYSTLQMICVGYKGIPLKDTGFPYIESKIIKPYFEFIKSSLKITMYNNKLILKKEKDLFFDVFERKVLNAKRFLHEAISLKDYNMFYDYFENNKIEKLKEFNEYHLYELVKSNNYKKIIQIGLNDGIGASYILKGLKETKGILYSLDNYQTIKYDNKGIEFIERMKYDSNFLFVNDKIPYKYLQALGKKEDEPESFDLVVINNMESYETILLEIYFSYKLLKKDGLLIIQNIISPNVFNAIKYIDNEWEFYEKQSNISPLFVIYKKKPDLVL